MTQYFSLLTHDEQDHVSLDVRASEDLETTDNVYLIGMALEQEIRNGTVDDVYEVDFDLKGDAMIVVEIKDADSIEIDVVFNPPADGEEPISPAQAVAFTAMETVAKKLNDGGIKTEFYGE